jgi:hypothetical protein
MGQSVYKWLFLYEDGTVKIVECTYDHLWDLAPTDQPVLITRVDSW